MEKEFESRGFPASGSRNRMKSLQLSFAVIMVPPANSPYLVGKPRCYKVSTKSPQLLSVGQSHQASISNI